MKFIYYIMLIIVANNLQAFNVDATRQLVSLIKKIDKKINLGKVNEALSLAQNIATHLENGADYNIKIRNNNIIDYAVMLSDSDLIEVCIKAGTTINVEALVLAQDKGNQELVQLLLSHIYKRNLATFTLVELLTHNYSKYYIYGRGIKSQAYIYFPLYLDLLENGAAPDAATAYGLRLIHFAAMTGDIAFITKCLQAGCGINVTMNGTFAFTLAQTNNQHALAEFLLDYVAENEKDPSKALLDIEDMVFNASQWRLPAKIIVFPAIIKCINRGADINSVLVANGIVPLQFIIYYYKDLPMIKFLLDAGADVNAINAANGWSVLDYARQTGRRKIIDLLVSYGVQIPSYRAHTARLLSEAIVKPKFSDIEKLLEGNKAVLKAVSWNSKNADEYINILPILFKEYEKRNCVDKRVNRTDRYGRTPLFIALSKRDFPAAQFLIEHGANPLYPWNKGPNVLFFVNHFKEFQKPSITSSFGDISLAKRIFQKAMGEFYVILAPLTLEPKDRTPYDKNKEAVVPVAVMPDILHYIVYWAVLMTAEDDSLGIK